jgi:thiamine biosynthesis lipoprotein
LIRHLNKRLVLSIVLFSSLIDLHLCAWPDAAYCQKRKTGTLAEFRFVALRMGTEFRILVYASDPLAAQKAALAAFDRVEELENILSDYRENSEVMRLCKTAVNSPQVVSAELFFVLQNALRISTLSGGAFDVTIGPVAKLWREGRKKKQVPDPAELQRARRRVGYANVLLNPDVNTVTLKIPDMAIDLGGIGKGYAADEALKVLLSRGFPSALVHAGGEVVVGDPPPGKKGWKIAIRKTDPADPEAPGHLFLHHRGVSTSGDAFQNLEAGGQKYSHIINPADGMGLKDSPTVTIIARDGITADALSTALDIMPAPEGLKLVESTEGASAVITRRSPSGFQHLYSKGFPKIRGGTTKTINMPGMQRNRKDEP